MADFKFATDTATMCVFDPDCLKHRLEDDADWWTVPSAELEEVNQGNVAFLGLNQDGAYEFRIVAELADAQIRVNLKVPSGRLFYGAGEEVTSDGMEPDCTRGGTFCDVEPGNYTLLARKDVNFLTLCLMKSGTAINQSSEPLKFR